MKRRWGYVALAVSVTFILGSTLALAFAEEPLLFRDPYTGELTDEEVSTIHNDLTYALALAAGFSISDSITLQVCNQLVDSEQLGPAEAISYTNCIGSFPDPPDPDIVCQGIPHNHAIWPRWDDMLDADTCVTSRFGPFSPFFHFPHNTAEELGALHDWAWGITNDLVGYEAYAWGLPADLTVMQARCLYTRTAIIDAGIDAGSLEAFGSYLHVLADYYSHRECLAAMDELGMPWATHTTPPLDESVPACDYHPRNPTADDVHGREFYTYTDSLRTDEAVLHVYDELVTRSLQREGEYAPIHLDTVISGTDTLRDVLYTFVHQWDFNQAAERRAWLDGLVERILASRRLVRQITLPFLVK
jgi:hypothetical protein